MLFDTTADTTQSATRRNVGQPLVSKWAYICIRCPVRLHAVTPFDGLWHRRSRDRIAERTRLQDRILVSQRVLHRAGCNLPQAWYHVAVDVQRAYPSLALRVRYLCAPRVHLMTRSEPSRYLPNVRCQTAAPGSADRGRKLPGAFLRGSFSEVRLQVSGWTPGVETI